MLGVRKLSYCTHNLADSKLFVGGEEGVDQDATAETFELVRIVVHSVRCGVQCAVHRSSLGAIRSPGSWVRESAGIKDVHAYVYVLLVGSSSIQSTNLRQTQNRRNAPKVEA